MRPARAGSPTMFSSSGLLRSTPQRDRFRITKSGCWHVSAVSDRKDGAGKGWEEVVFSYHLVFEKRGLFMWIVKGMLLGLWLTGFGTIAWLYFSIFRRLPPGPGEVGVTVFMAYTIQNPYWWTGVAVCLVFGFVIVRSCTIPLAFLLPL